MLLQLASPGALPADPAGAGVRALPVAVQANARDLELIFDTIFKVEFNTCLRGGEEEPVYLPPVGGQPARIYYRHDFFSSALHEVAHWCIAGEQRRRKTDYGYWYTPDGRDAGAQQRFEIVERKPQALEWIFSLACGIRFGVSLDNLGQRLDINREQCFKQSVLCQAIDFCIEGLPPRAAKFLRGLNAFYQPGLALEPGEQILRALRSWQTKQCKPAKPL